MNKQERMREVALPRAPPPESGRIAKLSRTAEARDEPDAASPTTILLRQRGEARAALWNGAAPGLYQLIFNQSIVHGA